MKYKILNTEYFNDDLYQFEVESKGCLLDINIEILNKIYILSFYDTYRFKEDIDEELTDLNFIQLSNIDKGNIFFLKKVTLKNILLAIDAFTKRVIKNKS